MIKTVIGIAGMSCGMCEAHVNDIIRRTFAVKSVKSSHRKRRTVIVSAQPPEEALLRKKLGELGYTVTEIHSEEIGK